MMRLLFLSQTQFIFREKFWHWVSSWHQCQWQRHHTVHSNQKVPRCVKSPDLFSLPYSSVLLGIWVSSLYSYMFKKLLRVYSCYFILLFLMLLVMSPFLTNSYVVPKWTIEAAHRSNGPSKDKTKTFLILKNYLYLFIY